MLLLLVVLGLAAALRKTPFGAFPDHCVHKVPSGSHITTQGDSDTLVVEHESFARPFVVPACHAAREKRQFPPDYDGWLAYTKYQSKTPTFDAFLGSFSVPNNPANDPDVLYIFTGLQNVDWIPKVDPIPPVFDIIQPVLQYPADSGSGWSVKSWYVTLDSGVIETDEILCNPGDIIFGNMTRLNQKVKSSNWFVAGVNTRTKESTSFTADKKVLKLQPWAYTTVECYGCEDCSYLPKDVLSFTDMALYSAGTRVNPMWKAFFTPTPVCVTTAHIKSGAEVDYSFQH